MALRALIANQIRRILAVYSSVECTDCAKTEGVNVWKKTTRSITKIEMLGAEQIKRITEKGFISFCIYLVKAALLFNGKCFFFIDGLQSAFGARLFRQFSVHAKKIINI